MLFAPKEKGQGLVEYALILVLVAIVVIAVLMLLGPMIGNVFSQINNALAFPGVFRGALDVYATRISEEMKVAAAHALANYVPKPHREHIVPAVLDRKVTRHVAVAVREAAIASGCARDI